MGKRSFAILALVWASGAGARVVQVSCHYNYGGAHSDIPVLATRDPYGAKTASLGSRFQVSAVLLHDGHTPPILKLRTEYLSEEGWRPIHIGEYQTPFYRSSHGFTGLQKVYEARTQAEVAFWCDWSDK